MLDLKELREGRDRIQQRLKERGPIVDLDGLLKLDEERRRLGSRSDQLKHKRNIASDEIARLKSQKQPTEPLLAEMKTVAGEIKQLDEEIRALDERLRARLLELPNLPHDSVPSGKEAADNVEVRRIGSPPTFAFDPKNHWELGEALGILDWERAAKLAGARFSLFTGLGARLSRALINLMMDLHAGEHGYREVSPPVLANRDSLTGTGQLPKFEEDLFRLADPDYFLIPTGEVPLTNLHRDEILSEEALPIRYAAYTPCFRREAGSYGKDSRGLIRQHQFDKVELVKFATPESSYDELERLVSDAEAVLKRLGLHYRVMLLCAGDMGFAAAKTYDLEVWLPGQNAFREISSCSNFEAFQARRGMIRFRRRGGKAVESVHTLNGSGLAVGRTVAAILENFQEADGTVAVPEALHPYMGGVTKITAGA